MTYGRKYSGNRNYRVWIKGRKAETERTMPADSKAQAQIRMANLWEVKSYEIECFWIKDGSTAADLYRRIDGEPPIVLGPARRRDVDLDDLDFVSAEFAA